MTWPCPDLELDLDLDPTMSGTWSGTLSLTILAFHKKFNSSLYLRYEIVYQYGGIYMDTDSKSIKPLSFLFRNSFVCYDASWNTIVNSVFGMPRGSKFLRFVLESAKLNSQQEEFRKRIVYLRYGPTFLGKMFFKFNDERINIIDSQYLIFNHTNSNFMIQVR